MVRQVVVDRRLEGVDTLEGTPANPLRCDPGKEALD